MKDTITIEELEVQCHIGVPEKERATRQKLLITLAMEADTSAAGAADDLRQTIDYHAVYLQAQELAEKGERQLIETLGEELAAMVLNEFQADAVTVIIRKFILPKTRHVELSIRRSRA